MTSYTAPPDQTGLILNAFDILNVFSGGKATGTIINENAVENVNPGGKALFTIVWAGAVLNVLDTGIATTINGGNENVAAAGTVTNTTINGGLEFLNAGTTAIDTIINAGGVQSGPGTAIGTIINEGGLQNVSGIAKDTIINGGLESVSNSGMADGVTFVGPHSTLALATPSGLTGFIRNWHVGDIIDFLNTMVTGVNETGNTLTVTYGDHQTASYSLAGQQANTVFKLQSDGHSGTELVLTGTEIASQVFSPETAGTIVYTAEYGSAPSATELNVLVLFVTPQYGYGQQIGVTNPAIYAYQSLGVALASTATHFQNTFGPSSPLYPASTVGDIHFVDDAYVSVFGHPGSAAQVQHFVDQLAFFDTLYTAAGMFGTATNIDLLARGAVYGQMLGIEHEINPGDTPIGSQPSEHTFTAPPAQSHLVLNGGDTLNVEVNGLAYGTLINQGAVLNVASGGTDIGTTNNGGNEYVFGTSTGMTINFGGLAFVEAGATIGTMINAGGTEYDQGGASIGTTINLGGSQYVQNGSTATDTTIDGASGIQYVDGGTSIGTTIKAGGFQIVRNGGTANDTIIQDGGIEHVFTSGTANNVIFAGSNSLLELDKPSGLTGTIIDWNVGEKIDFVNTMVTSVNETGNTLTVTYGDHQTASYSLVGKQTNTEFKLQPDGNGGTDLILQLPLKVGDATSAHLLSLAGGGIKAMTADAGLFAGLLQHFGSEGASTTIGDLLSKVSAVSANSGSSWFTDLLAYSPSFEDSLQDYTYFFSKNGYMGELEIAYNNYAKAPSGKINEFIVEILKEAGAVAGMELDQLYGLLVKSSVNWNDFLTNVIFEPDTSAKLLQSVNFHSDQSHRADALPSQSLIFQSSISSNEAAINKYDSEFGITTNETVSTITNAGTDSSGNTYIFIPAVITSLGSETDISAPALPSISTGSLNVTYSTYAGSPSATTVLANFTFDGLSAFLATSASSAAGSAASSGGVYNSVGFGGFTKSVSAALNEVQNISPLVQVNNASGISTAFDPAPGILDGYTTPDFLVTQGHSLLRLADGAYIDNTSVTSGMTYLQANNHLSNFTVTALTYFDGVDQNLGKINPGYNKIGQQAETLFTGSDQHQAVPIPHTNLSINLSHPSAAVFDSAQTTGLDKPIWEYVGSKGFKLDYFQLGVTTAKNDMGIAVGERGTLDLWVVTTSAPALPSLNGAGWEQYSDLYDQMRFGLQSVNNGHIGADLLASNLGLQIAMGATVADVQLTGVAPHLDHAMI